MGLAATAGRVARRSQRGGAGHLGGLLAFLALDTIPDYLDPAALPAAGTSAVWKYKPIYRLNDDPATAGRPMERCRQHQRHELSRRSRCTILRCKKREAGIQPLFLL